MKSFKTTILIASLSATTGSVWAAPAEKCGGADIANGPFAYTQTGIFNATFSGTGGDVLNAGFDVAAPMPKTDTAAENVFPGQGGLNECAFYADAFIGVLEIELVADASGNPLSTPVKVALDSALGQAIAGAVSVAPGAWNAFVPGGKTPVSVNVTNPNAGPAYYGEYALKLAAKADGFGIGVGPGVMLSLVLTAPTLTDKTAPTVTINKPAVEEILGKVAVEILASDPNDSVVATGLASLSASVSSAGGKVLNLPLALTLDQALTAAAGVMVTGTGEFIPTGGTGDLGTVIGSPFAAVSPSGIGTYTLKATAKDGAGNTTVANKTFKVGYDVGFTKEFSTTPCQTAGNANCTGQFKFTVNRSSTTSDGAFMVDQSVVVKLRDTGSNAVVASHSYGTGAIGSYVQVDTAAPSYQTNFRRGDWGATAPKAYKAEVYFVDVDGIPVLQKTSNAVTF